uniref:SH3 domain-containing protein n=1 Tax=Prevotella sp. GTC17253 TaxID=3236793 RepID=A0AB33ITC3_9BACT
MMNKNNCIIPGGLSLEDIQTCLQSYADTESGYEEEFTLIIKSARPDGYGIFYEGDMSFELFFELIYALYFEADEPQNQDIRGYWKMDSKPDTAPMMLYIGEEEEPEGIDEQGRVYVQDDNTEETILVPSDRTGTYRPYPRFPMDEIVGESRYQVTKEKPSAGTCLAKTYKDFIIDGDSPGCLGVLISTALFLYTLRLDNSTILPFPFWKVLVGGGGLALLAHYLLYKAKHAISLYYLFVGFLCLLYIPNYWITSPDYQSKARIEEVGVTTGKHTSKYIDLRFLDDNSTFCKQGDVDTIRFRPGDTCTVTRAKGLWGIEVFKDMY